MAFDGSGSTDLDGDETISGWMWSFGDDSTGYGETIGHLYEQDGTYNVGLVVVDDNALESSSAATTVTVYDVAPDATRVAYDFQTPYRVRFCAEFDTPNIFDNLMVCPDI